MTPRPVVDVALEGLLDAPIECLLDTGALPTRMSMELAPLAGIELSDALIEEFFIAGVTTVGALARVSLTVADGARRVFLGGSRSVRCHREHGYVMPGRFKLHLQV